MRRTLCLLATSAVPLMVTVAAAGPAHAQAAVTDVGWWTRNPGATAPEGGFQVALGAGQPMSVAAIGVSASGGEVSSAVLSLTQATAGVRQDAARMQVCATTSQWQPTQGGPYDAAPEPDCTMASATLDDEGSAWRADVAQILRALDEARPSSLMILPIADTSLPVDPGFEVQFSRASIAVQTSAPPAAAPGTPAPTAPPAPPAPPSRAADPPAVPAPARPEVTPAPEAPVEASPGPAGALPAGTGADVDDRPWWRVAILAPVSAIVGIGSVALRRFLRDRGWAEV